MAKAQMEILGLAVIVVLVLLGMFFLTKFTLFEQPQSEVQSIQRSQIATNFVSALLNSKANCTQSSATFTDLIDDLEEPSYSLLECNGMSGSDLITYFNETAISILNQTLGKWGYEYEFTVVFPLRATDSRDIMISNVDCGSKQEQPAKYFIPGDLGDITVTLKICY